MAFIKSERNKECIFCTKAREDDDRTNFILYRGQHSYLLLNIYPYTSGHLMAAPYAHVGSILDLEGPVLEEMMLLVQRCIRALQRSLKPHGFNVGFNLGKAAGAGIDDHVHLHIVPRWEGDTNFLPVLADTRLIPEALEETYRRLIEAGIAE